MGSKKQGCSPPAQLGLPSGAPWPVPKEPCCAQGRRAGWGGYGWDAVAARKPSFTAHSERKRAPIPRKSFCVPERWRGGSRTSQTQTGPRSPQHPPAPRDKERDGFIAPPCKHNNVATSPSFSWKSPGVFITQFSPGQAAEEPGTSCWGQTQPTRQHYGAEDRVGALKETFC